MTLVPSWAPNVHPLVIHFPIVLWMIAAAIELIEVVVGRPTWLRTVSTSFYIAGAAAAGAAYLTGARAGSTVLVPGMAHPALAAHRSWALATTWYCAVAALVRLVAWRAGLIRTRATRVLLLTAGVIGVLLVQQTAERGARLVFEYGTGVVAAH